MAFGIKEMAALVQPEIGQRAIGALLGQAARPIPTPEVSRWLAQGDRVEEDDFVSATGRISTAGVVAITGADDVFVMTSRLIISAAGDLHEANDVAVGASKLAVVGAASIVEANDVSTGQGGGVLFDPVWAPDQIRYLQPVVAADYTTTGREYPTAAAFVASTVRRMRDVNNPLILNDFAANVPRQSEKGRYLEGWAVDRLVPSGDTPTSLGVSSSVVITAMAGNPQGSHNSARLATGVSTSFNALGQTSTFSANAGDELVCSFLFAFGTSGRIRIRLTSAAGTSTITLVQGSTFSFPDQANGLIAPELIDRGNDIYEMVCRVTAATTQSTYRWMIGPNLPTAGADIIVHEVKPFKSRHPLELITGVAVTGGDFQTRGISGLGLTAFVGRFVCAGWAPGVTQAVQMQFDDGTDNNRVSIYVDTAAMVLKADFVIGGTIIATLTMDAVVIGAQFTVAVSWGPSDWRAQMRNGAYQSSTAAGTMPAMTVMRPVKGAGSVRQAAATMANSFAFDKLLNSNQMAEALAGATGAFEPLKVTSQIQLDVPETINGQAYIKDAFPGDWTIRRSVIMPTRLRFETRIGYRDDYDQVNDRDYIRSELHGYPNMTVGELWFAFDTTPVSIPGALPIFNADGITRRSYTQANLCQLKSSPDPTGLPMFAINLNLDGYRVIVGGGDAIVGADGNDRSDYYFQSIVPTVGVKNQWVAQVKPGRPGSGLIRLWHNHIKILDVSNIEIGYPETTQMFPKGGLYCNYNVGPMIVDIDNFRVGADLSALVA